MKRGQKNDKPNGKRVYAIIQVGKYISIDKMLEQIKEEEAFEMYNYVRMFFANTHGLSQEEEMKIWGYQSKGKELGFEYLEAIKNYLLDAVLK